MTSPPRPRRRSASTSSTIRRAGRRAASPPRSPDVVWTGPNRRVSTKVVLPAGSGRCTHLPPAHERPSGLHLRLYGREYGCRGHRRRVPRGASSIDQYERHHAHGSGARDDRLRLRGGADRRDCARRWRCSRRPGVHQTSTSFTTTHPGTGQYVVTGLETGIYDVVRGVTTIVDDEAVDENGTIAFESVAGAFAITRSRVPGRNRHRV